MLLIGNIDYDAAPGQDDESNHNQLSKEAAGGELLTFERLKSAPEEIRWFQSQFQRRFPAGTMRTLQQSQATEAEFRREAPQHRWLFIATHGFLAPPNITAALATQDELVGLDPGISRTPAPKRRHVRISVDGGQSTGPARWRRRHSHRLRSFGA